MGGREGAEGGREKAFIRQLRNGGLSKKERGSRRRDRNRGDLGWHIAKLSALRDSTSCLFLAPIVCFLGPAGAGGRNKLQKQEVLFTQS